MQEAVNNLTWLVDGRGDGVLVEGGRQLGADKHAMVVDNIYGHTQWISHA